MNNINNNSSNTKSVSTKDLDGQYLDGQITRWNEGLRVSVRTRRVVTMHVFPSSPGSWGIDSNSSLVFMTVLQFYEELFFFLNLLWRKPDPLFTSTRVVRWVWERSISHWKDEILEKNCEQSSWTSRVSVGTRGSRGPGSSVHNPRQGFEGNR